MNDRVVRLSRSKSRDVRFLVSSNPNLSEAEIDLFIVDEDDFVRSGAACNTALSSRQIEILRGDPSHTVYCKLAGNPLVPEAVLLQLYRDGDLDLVWFAMNPNCPEQVREAIHRSNNTAAQKQLERTEAAKS